MDIDYIQQNPKKYPFLIKYIQSNEINPFTINTATNIAVLEDYRHRFIRKVCLAPVIPFCDAIKQKRECACQCCTRIKKWKKDYKRILITIEKLMMD